MDKLQAFGALAPALVLIGAVLLLGVLMRAIPGLMGPPAPVAKAFMTRREQAMLAAIEQILPMYRIHAQVAMGALLKVPSITGRRRSRADRNAFAQKIVDFVVEDPTTGRVVALIEVDDASHRRENDRARDLMTARAGYRTLRIPASARPTVAAVLRFVGPLRDEAAQAAFQE